MRYIRYYVFILVDVFMHGKFILYYNSGVDMNIVLCIIMNMNYKFAKSTTVPCQDRYTLLSIPLPFLRQ
jgi:hypothetical protein